MKKDVQYFAELRKTYPKTMSKDQFYRVAHISKATALYLLSSGVIPCKDTGKKTRRYTIKTEDVIKYLVDRRIHPNRYAAPPGWYSGTAGKKKKQEDDLPMRSIRELSRKEKNQFKKYLELELNDYDDLLKVKHIAEFTGYCSTTIIGWCNAEHLKYFSINGQYLIPKISFIEFLLSPVFDDIKIKTCEHKLLLCDFFEKIARDES